MGRMRKLLIPGVDKQLLVKDAAKVMPDLARRRFISRRRQPRRAGAADRLRRHRQRLRRAAADARFPKFNDAVQALMFNPERWRRHSRKARSPSRSRSTPITISTTRPRSTARSGSSRCAGWSTIRSPWTLDELYELPQVKQITRHICVEGWSAIGSWTGRRLRDFLKLIGADTRAKYVWFQCADRRLQLAARHARPRCIRRPR